MPAKRIVDEKKLKLTANTIRQDIVSMIAEAGTGHPGGSLGMADVFTAMYFNVLKHDPKKPDWAERDILVLSNGHICPVRYAAMAESGYFPVKELMTLRKFGSRLQGHPHRGSLPGLETTSGPLGCGISQAAGMALALKMDKKKNHVYCIASDGEHDEGNTWEALMFANKMKLSNLTVIIDRNNIQIDGHTEEVMPLEPLRQKYESFGWRVVEIDGHDIPGIIDALKEKEDAPTCIIAHTTPGKGVSFMEDDPEWHGKAPNAEQTKAALKELQDARKKLEKN